MTALEQFMNLSGILTGVDELDSVLGESYRLQLEESYCADMTSLYAAYRKAVMQPDPAAQMEAIFKADSSGRLWLAASQIIKAWYLAQFDDPGDKATITRKANDPKLHFAPPSLPLLPGQIQRGLIWRIIQAHPPAYSVQPSGYWASKPQS